LGTPTVTNSVKSAKHQLDIGFQPTFLRWDLSRFKQRLFIKEENK
jgi:hypothetical protein